MTQVVLKKTKPNTSGFSLNNLKKLFGVARQRRTLASLDNRALKDIGVTRTEANIEANRSFWDVPDFWLK